jgi:hypothetical protein
MRMYIRAIRHSYEHSEGRAARTCVEVVYAPITLQLKGLSFTRHYECTDNIKIRLMEGNSASHSGGVRLNSQPEE